MEPLANKGTSSNNGTWISITQTNAEVRLFSMFVSFMEVCKVFAGSVGVHFLRSLDILDIYSVLKLRCVVWKLIHTAVSKLESSFEIA